MEPPPDLSPRPPAPDDGPPDATPLDGSSLGLGVALGLLGVPLLLGAALASFGWLQSLLMRAGSGSELFLYAMLAVGLALFVGVPMVVYRQGRRRMGQGVLIGYGILALAIGGCLTWLANASFH